VSDLNRWRRHVSTVVLALCLLVAVGFAAYMMGKRRGMVDSDSRGAVASIVPTLSLDVPEAYHTKAAAKAPSVASFDLFGISYFNLAPPSDGVVQVSADSVRLRPDNPDAHLGFGTTLYLRGNYAAAASEFQKAVKLRPDEPTAHNNLGVALYALGDHNAAADEFRTAANRSGGASYAKSNAETLDLMKGPPSDRYSYSSKPPASLPATPAAAPPPR